MKLKHVLSLVVFPLAAAAVYACSSSDTPAGPDPDAGSKSDASSEPDAGPDANADAGAVTWSVVASFDPTAFELAEGLVVHGGNAYVGLAPLGRILKIGPDGKKSVYATIPPGYSDGYALGLVFDAAENLYVLATKNNPDAGAIVPGVYKIPPNADGGAFTTPFATDPEIVFPNGAAFDDGGRLFVADSATGNVFAITPAGVVSKWATGALLAGSPACPAPLPFPIGANGILVSKTEVLVTNTAKGSIVKIPVNADGSAGAQTTLLADCQYVGLDGMARAADGSLLVAQNGGPGRILRVQTSGTVSVVHAGAPLDGPASLAIADGWNGSRVALVTSSAFFSINADGGAPKPALLAFTPAP